MPMTKRQLEQVATDYDDHFPIRGEVIDCREQYSHHDRERCDICGYRFNWRPWAHNRGEQIKEITIRLAECWGAHSLRYRVCRNGVACRRRANQGQAEA